MAHLADQLERDLRWREAELASLKVQTARSPTGSVLRQILLRSLSAMLYAHFEGFCKFAWESYFDELEHTKRPRNEFIVPLRRFSLSKKLRELRGNLSDESIWDFVETELAVLLGKLISFDDRFDEHENLWPDTVRENSRCAGLQLAEIDNHAVALKALVSRRNDIAHGKKMYIKDLAEYQKFENAATVVMHELAIVMVESLDTNSYLAQPSP